VGGASCKGEQHRDTLFACSVTEPVREIARPEMEAPSSSVMFLRAKMFPTNVVRAPIVAELVARNRVQHQRALAPFFYYVEPERGAVASGFRALGVYRSVCLQRHDAQDLRVGQHVAHNLLEPRGDLFGDKRLGRRIRHGHEGGVSCFVPAPRRRVLARGMLVFLRRSL
jgi:hypothetical protein